MLNTLLELKAMFWGLDSTEYMEWKEYFLSLSKHELKLEYYSHFPKEIK